MLLIAIVILAIDLLVNCRTTTAPNPQTAEDPVVAFIRANPDRSAVFLVRNDTTLVSLRPDQKFPLASTVKIIVAIEFAKQAAAGKLNPQEMISLLDTDRYYLPNTDGGAHPNWKAGMKSKNLVSNDRVPLLDVAKGMIRYSSNANTEYLMDRLGFDNINANLTELSLPKHDRLLPIVAPLMLYSTTDKQSTLQRVRATSAQEYETQSLAIHQRLKQDGDGSFKKQFVFPNLELQKLWSDRLAGSTVREYASALEKLNKRTYYAPAVQTMLDQIMEWPFIVKPDNRSIYEHIGSKGGSTAFVLANALYATDKAGNRSELVFFFNNLTSAENKTLQKDMNTFLINCIQPNRYQQTVSDLTN